MSNATHSPSLVSVLLAVVARATQLARSKAPIQCTCCGAPVIWEALASIGLMDCGPGEPQLDLRNCVYPGCGSTLAAEVTL